MLIWVMFQLDKLKAAECWGYINVPNLPNPITMIFHSAAAIELQFETESICVLLIGVMRCLIVTRAK